MRVIQFRDATIADVETLVEIHLAAVVAGYVGIFPPAAAPPTRRDLAAQWRAELAHLEASVIMAEVDGVVCGNVAIRPDPADRTRGDLRRLHVRPECWDAGTGGQLHDVALERMRGRGWHRASLWALEANARARGMYERRGWRLTDERKHPWPDLAVAEVRYERQLDIA